MPQYLVQAVTESGLVSAAAVQTVINQHAANGWRVIAVTAQTDNSGRGRGVLVTFEKADARPTPIPGR